MKLKRLTVDNYRGFKHLELSFENDETVLVGVNGAGKTSLLNAIALSLSWLTTGIITGEASGTELTVADVRVEAKEVKMGASVQLEALIDGAPTTWTLSVSLPGHSVEQPQDLRALEKPIAAVRASIAEGTPKLPIALYFPTNRSALDIPARISKPHEFDALSAYDGALESGASNFRGFFEWVREEEDALNELLAAQMSLFDFQRLDPKNAAYVQAQHAPVLQVRKAIEQLFPGGESLRIERKPRQRMMITTRGVRIDVAQLSDGEKCLLAMAGDLARRMVLASPGAEKPLEQEAVVLIDELELHLHPGLQRTILPNLRRIFPNTQFIVSSHSPQVLSSVHARNVRVLDGFSLRELDRGTWQRDTNAVLEAAFNDPGRPLDVAEKLNALRDAVDDERYDDARALITKLRSMTEGDDPDVFYLEQMLPPVAGADSAP